MKLLSNNEGIIHLEFPTPKALTMTMGRLQEYYESAHANLFRQVFTVEEFLETFMDDDGVVSYYDQWVGFNVPGDIVERFFRDFTVTDRESNMHDLVMYEMGAVGPHYYLIATLPGDGATADHELVHAAFYLDPEYQGRAIGQVSDLQDDLRVSMMATLSAMGYADDVLIDEVNAYLSTATHEYLLDRFGLDVPYEVVWPFRSAAQTTVAEFTGKEQKFESYDDTTV